MAMSKLSGRRVLATFANLPAFDLACLESSVKLTTWLGDSVESVNHLWAANHATVNIICIVHI